MSSIEFEGETERAAVVKACSALKQAEGQLDYTVIDEGSAGLFGLGARPVRIRVRAPEANVTESTEIPDEGPMDADVGDREEEGSSVCGPAPEKAARAGEVAESLAERMGLPCKVAVRDEDSRIVVVLDEVEGSTAVADMLGRSRPPAVPSFQFLLNKIVNRFPEGRKHILVEVPSVPRKAPSERRPRKSGGDAVVGDRPRGEVDPELDATLVALAHSLAERAKSLGKVITIHPMLPGDRRAIHQTITAIDGVSTVSSGDGLYRRMHIVPRDGAAGGEGGQGQRRGRRRRRRGRGGMGSGPRDASGGADRGPVNDEPSS
ncbi:MAG: Jag N-terminal domain-containing protein [Deltaproteobacteria bacterium]|nr:Jag N-terminal domain-containing protein [Deltaproteobacteria bacterium]